MAGVKIMWVLKCTDYLVKWFKTVSRAYIFHNVQFCLNFGFSTAYDFHMCLFVGISIICVKFEFTKC